MTSTDGLRLAMLSLVDDFIQLFATYFYDFVCLELQLQF